VGNRIDRRLQPEPDFPKFKAKVLLINTVEDEANPPELVPVHKRMIFSGVATGAVVWLGGRGRLFTW
jgi:hypothetical protein